jgi:hypothetical protein
VPTTLLDRRPAEKTERSPEVVLRVTGDGGGSGRRRSLLSMAFMGAVVLVVVLVAGSVAGLLDLGGLFSKTDVDRSPPVLLKELRNLAEFHAAEGEFEATIDKEEDVPVLPSFIWGESVIFVAVGTVPASVDFSGLSGDAVQVTADGAVTISLPAPVLGEPVVDPRRSHVADRDRGIVDRIGGVFEDDPTSERELYLAAGKRLAKAARESNLVERAKENTTKMLDGLLRRLGFSQIEIRFVTIKGSVQPKPAATTR